MPCNQGEMGTMKMKGWKAMLTQQGGCVIKDEGLLRKRGVQQLSNTKKGDTSMKIKGY